MDHCDECGFDYDLDDAESAGDRILAGAGELTDMLMAAGQRVGRRTRPDTWSPLEYGCHVRDVLLVQRERVFLARLRDRPDFVPMGRDERVDFDGYAGQAASDVARQLVDAATLFANVLSRLGPAEWERTVMYSYPEPTARSLRWVAVHTVHEAQHHLLDIRRQLSGDRS